MVEGKKTGKERKQRSWSESRLTGGFYGNPGLESRSVVDTKEKPSHGCIEMGPKNMATQRDSLASRLIAGRPNFLLIQNAQGIVCTVTYTLHSSTVVLSNELNIFLNNWGKNAAFCFVSRDIRSAKWRKSTNFRIT
jgi:hypothetical protein